MGRSVRFFTKWKKEEVYLFNSYLKVYTMYIQIKLAYFCQQATLNLDIWVNSPFALRKIEKSTYLICSLAKFRNKILLTYSALWSQKWNLLRLIYSSIPVVVQNLKCITSENTKFVSKVFNSAITILYTIFNVPHVLYKRFQIKQNK